MSKKLEKHQKESFKLSSTEDLNKKLNQIFRHARLRLARRSKPIQS